MPLTQARMRPNEVSPFQSKNQSKISVKGYKRSFVNAFNFSNGNNTTSHQAHNFIGEKNPVSREVAVSQRFMDYKRNEIKTRSFTLENEARKKSNKT